MAPLSVFMATAMATLAVADFNIYRVSTTGIVDPADGNFVQWDGAVFVTGLPSCEDACNAVFITEGDAQDVSISSGMVLEGETDDPDPAKWTIDRFEYHNVPFQDGEIDIHFTLYADRTVNFGTPMVDAKGGPDFGTCVRSFSDDFQCTCGIGDNYQGAEMFSCITYLTPETAGGAPA